MFEPRTPEPTDQELVELLATRGMGWTLHGSSGHRPGTRDVPHAWRWHRGTVRIMVYLGGGGPEANVEFDPLNCQGSATELVARLAARDIDVSGWDVTTAEGRRSTCEEARRRLTAPPLSEPTPEEVTPEETAPTPEESING